MGGAGSQALDRRGEEVVRAITWFHPAMWWALREVQLAREEVAGGGELALVGRSLGGIQAPPGGVELEERVLHEVTSRHLDQSSAAVASSRCV